MWIAILVFIVTSFMLISAYVRGWLPAVMLLGSGLLAVPIVWAVGTLGLIATGAPPTLVIMAIGSIWAAPIAIFLVDAAINRPLDLLLTLPPVAAQVWAITTLMAGEQSW